MPTVQGESQAAAERLPEAEIVSPDLRHVLIAHNPRAGWKGRRRHLQELGEALRRQDLIPEIIADLDVLQQQALALIEEGKLRTVMAAGGDGTASAVINLLPPNVPIAPYPMGTENLLARYLRWRRSTDGAARWLSEGIVVQLDAGRANGRLFVLMIGIGFDAEVVRGVAEARRGHITRFSYTKPLLSAMRNYPYPELSVRCSAPESPDSGPPDSELIKARWVFGVNLPKYTLGLKFSPAAEGNDGLLDVCTFARGSTLNGFRYLGYLLAGRHTRLPDVRISRCARMVVECEPGLAVPYQLDGDHGGCLPVKVEMLPGRFRAVVGKRAARELGFRLPPGVDA